MRLKTMCVGETVVLGSKLDTLMNKFYKDLEKNWPKYKNRKKKWKFPESFIDTEKTLLKTLAKDILGVGYEDLLKLGREEVSRNPEFAINSSGNRAKKEKVLLSVQHEDKFDSGDIGELVESLQLYTDLVDVELVKKISEKVPKKFKTATSFVYRFVPITPKKYKALTGSGIKTRAVTSWTESLKVIKDFRDEFSSGGGPGIVYKIKPSPDKIWFNVGKLAKAYNLSSELIREREVLIKSVKLTHKNVMGIMLKDNTMVPFTEKNYKKVRRK